MHRAAQAQAHLPFYWHQPGEVGYRHIVPIFYFSTWDREGSTAVQFPFFAHTRNYADESSTTIIPPLLFWYGSYAHGQGQQVGFMPLFFWKRHGPQKWFVAPLLLSGGQSNSKEDLVEAVVGLVGYYRRHHDDTWRVLVPLLFDHQTATTRTTIVPPLLAVFKHTATSRTDVVFPLLWHLSNKTTGTDHLLFLPFFDYDSDHHGRHTRLTSPIALWERNDDTKLKQLFLLTPPIFHREDTRRNVDVVPPVFVRWKVHDDGSTGLIAGPFFHSSDPEGSTTSLLPLYWRFADKSGAETQFLFPVIGYHRHPGAGGAFLGPLYGWGSRNGLGGWGGGLAPILMFGRSGTKHHAVVAPIFAHWSDDKDRSSTTAVGPIFHHQVANGGGWDAGLFPVLFFGRRAATTYATLPPLFFHKSGPGDVGSTDVVGPVFVRRDPKGWSAGLAPLVFFGNRDGRQHQVILPPLFIHFADERAHTSSLLVGPFYHGRDGAETVDALFPLFYLRHSPHEALLISPLAGWKKDPQKQTETVVVGPFGYQRNDKKRSRTWFLFPLGAIHESPNYKVTVQFPFYWRVHEGEETDTTLFPIYWRVRSPEKSVDAVFPILLHAKTKIATTTLFGPLWNRHRVDGGRSLGLFPLFAYGRLSRKTAEGETRFRASSACRACTGTRTI